MTTSDQNQSQPQGGEGGTGAGTAAAPQQAESGGARHGRRRRSGGGGGGGGRPEQPRQPQPSRRHESGLNMDELRELTELFTAHGLTDFEFENADIRIRLARTPAQVAAPAAAPGPVGAMQSAGAQAASAQQAPAGSGAAPQQPAAAPEPPEEELHIVAAEMVGTFYRASSPTAEPFVKVGSQVEAGTVVCIIEAMKLMNEIESDAAGTIAKIYVENGQPVEYGQPLFGVRK
ncbi:MAG TPA: acetyl-CoA carboxylase biotin carboxyl carrier protein [Pyrinomonadaceae bacterium]|jgi:acetyl-CoA carboxylase biotin carboxyl carrier protein